MRLRAMISLQNFFVGAAVIKVDIPIIITMLISNIMLMKVGFLAYAGYKIAVCKCSGWVGIFIPLFLSAQFSFL